MGAYSYNPSTQEECKFKACLSYTARLCLINKTGVVAHACYASTWELEARVLSRVERQVGLHSKALLLKKILCFLRQGFSLYPLLFWNSL